MIAKFSVSNYRSIKDKQTISFYSTSDKTSRALDTYEVAPGIFINKLAIFIGPNASGKSNILQALQALVMMMSRPGISKNENISQYIPFKMYTGQPVKMSLEFYLDTIRYIYNIEYNNRAVLQEALYYVPSRSKALVYSRNFSGEDQQPEINFGTTIGLFVATKNELKKHTYNNSSVLSTISKLSLGEDAEILKKIVRWLDNRIMMINNIMDSSGYGPQLLEIDKNAEKRALLLKLLAKADFNITDFRIINQQESNRQKAHILFMNHSEQGDFETPLEFQSDGTLRFIELIDSLYNISKGNYVYLLDELGNKLHYDLLVYYLQLFLYGAISSQVIFTSQSILLLDEDFVRTDTVYFTEKDGNTASTSYVRASDLGLRKGMSLYKRYRIGKIGSVPNVGSPYFE